jgi:signal transduction histidine kinase
MYFPVMGAAQHHQVVEPGVSTSRPFLDVVDFRPARWPITSRVGASMVASGDRSGAQSRVLVLYSARQGQPSFTAFDAALEDDLTERLAGHVDLYREYLDNGRFALTDEYQRTFRTYLRDKYRDRPDVVVAVALAAVGFVHQYGEELFPQVPSLLVATTDRLSRRHTNVFSEPDWNGSLNLALQVQPGTERVFVVTGASELDLQALAGARRQFTALERRLTFTYLTGLPIDDLERTVATLPPNSIIYYVNMALDGAQRRFEAAGALDRIAAVANVPIYIQSEAYIGRGVMGGHVWSSRPWGLKSSEIIVRLLNGETPEAIPPSRVDIYSDQLDWRQLQRWKIDERLIPAGTHLLFREPGFWEEYKVYILGVFALVLTQSSLIGGLLFQRKRRRRIEANLRESEQRYRVASERNQDLSGRLIGAQEEERARIARDLHDDISQQLTVMGIMLDSLKDTIGQPGWQSEVVQTLDTLQQGNTALSKSVRNISHHLHPEMLPLVGLNVTLKRHCDTIQQHHQVTVLFSAPDDLRSLSPHVALCLFRVAQEALTNAVRYARANTIRVCLARRNDSIDLEISDDGVGFVPDDPARSGLGLRSIHERARLVGGTVTLESRPGHGTRVFLVVPLAEVPDRFPVLT